MTLICIYITELFIIFIRLEKLIDLVEFSKLATHRYPPASQGELQDSQCVEAAEGGALQGGDGDSFSWRRLNFSLLLLFFSSVLSTPALMVLTTLCVSYLGRQ